MAANVPGLGVVAVERWICALAGYYAKPLLPDVLFLLFQSFCQPYNSSSSSFLIRERIAPFVRPKCIAKSRTFTPSQYITVNSWSSSSASLCFSLISS